MTWQDITTAPRDGTWVLLEGEMRGGGTSTAMIGRWNPISNEIGVYEWQCFVDSHGAGAFGCDEVWEDAEPQWNWYCEGRISQWQHLPE